MDMGVFMILGVLSIILVGGAFVLTFVLPTFHDYTCLCNACKRAYIREKTKNLEADEKRLEWYRWRNIVDEHFSDIEKKRFQ